LISCIGEKKDNTMSLGLILVIILIIFLLGGFSGRFGGYGYGFGHGGIGVIGIVVIILVVLVVRTNLAGSASALLQERPCLLARLSADCFQLLLLRLPS
jgi:Na+/melibiose symporter-like transporter